jgi:hypothetical protein
MRFHVLLNSLFKVLCNFPSRYLFAIGLAGIFSLSTSLRAALACTLKQADSLEEQLAAAGASRYGSGTHYGAPLKGTCTPQSQQQLIATPLTRHPALTSLARVARLRDGLVPFRSPLLRESLLVSFPPLSDMLKFSG